MQFRLFAVILATALAASGCATRNVQSSAAGRPFNFQTDTFAYANELVWEYGYDATGKWTSTKREPKSDYTQHCFVVARSARQFFENARFDPSQPQADEKTYRKLVRKVVSSSPRIPLPEAEKIVIPGYSDLRTFSRAWEQLLKQECGSATQSYVQRGNWRTIFPFSRKNQANAARRLNEEVRNDALPIVHVVRFPDLKINHAVLLLGSTPVPEGTEFTAYDPNEPGGPTKLLYVQERRTFILPQNRYFEGGDVNVYEIYSAWNY